MKAQVSTDFMIAIGMGLIFFVILFYAINERNTVFGEKRTELYAKELADRFATELNAVYLSGPGSFKTIQLPDNLPDQTLYAISVYPSEQLIEIVWYTNEVNRYTAPTVAPIGQNLSNIFQSVNVSYLDELIFFPDQEFFEVDAFCKGKGYGYGLCRKGAAHCQSAETFENEGNRLCTREDGGVACCG